MNLMECECEDRSSAFCSESSCYKRGQMAMPIHFSELGGAASAARLGFLALFTRGEKNLHSASPREAVCIKDDKFCYPSLVPLGLTYEREALSHGAGEGSCHLVFVAPEGDSEPPMAQNGSSPHPTGTAFPLLSCPSNMRVTHQERLVGTEF